VLEEREKTGIVLFRFKGCCALSEFGRDSLTNLHKVDEQHPEQTVQFPGEIKASSQFGHIYPILYLK